MISEALKTASLEYHHKHCNLPHVVSPSLPILYFGDTVRYKRSELKIVTVGKNPSDNEFRQNRNAPFSFCRFPSWNPERCNLLETLNEYFEKNPLRQWFSCYEPILNGMNCSFYRGKNKYANTAIHTDICSPLATSPTWSNLPDNDKEQLYGEGVNLWRRLIGELQPSIMLVSVPVKLFHEVFGQIKMRELISFKSKQDGTSRKRPYQVYECECSLGQGVHHTKIIFGQAANKPFDTISNEQKIKMGKSIGER